MKINNYWKSYKKKNLNRWHFNPLKKNTKDYLYIGNISEINTHITAPCPIAWDAIKRKRKTGTHIPPQFKKKAAATREREII